MTVHLQRRIRSRAVPDCYVCGARGVPLYENLRDRLFGAPGEWNLARCPNTGCGLLWLDPMPVEEDIAEAYASYFTHQDQTPRPPSLLDHLTRQVLRGYLAIKYGYEAEEVNTLGKFLGNLMRLFPAKSADLDFGVFYLRPIPGGRLLDVGCGSGVMLERMRKLGWMVEGVDFDSAAASNARSKGLSVQVGDLTALRFAPDRFDAVVMSHLIEHVHDPSKLLSECRRILKPHGKLVCATPNASSLGHRLYGRDWRGLEPPRHLHLFTPASMKRLAIEAGFRTADVACTVSGARDVFSASRETRRARRRRTDMARPRRRSLWPTMMQNAEWAISVIDRHAGETLVLTAIKESD